MSFQLEKDRADIVYSRYKILEKYLTDNSFFNEEYRIKIHDTIGHKVTELLFIENEDYTTNNLKEIQDLNNEISYLLNKVKKDIKNMYL